MRQLFLFGGSLGEQFGPTSRPFLKAAGGKEGRIALLFPEGTPGWERFLPLYASPWADGVGEVIPILPEPDGSLSEAALAELGRATGIFMCGGDTRIYQRVPGSEGDCQEELQIKPGLGLLTDLIVEAHLSEEGGLPRLFAAMERSGAPRGLGLDEQICVTIQDESHLYVAGRGWAYLVQRTGPGRFETQILEPGESASL